MLLFLFGDFLFDLDSFFFLLPTFLLFGNFFSLFFLSLDFLFDDLFFLLCAPLSAFFLIDDFSHFSLVLLFGKNIRYGLLWLFVGQLLVQIGNKFEMLNSFGLFFKYFHLLWSNFHSRLLIRRFD